MNKINANKYVNIDSNNLYFKIIDFLNDYALENIKLPSYSINDNGTHSLIHNLEEHYKIKNEDILKEFISSFFVVESTDNIDGYIENQNCFLFLKMYCYEKKFEIKSLENLYYLTAGDE